MSDREAKFWARVDRGSEIDCWPWLAGTRSTGYGSFYDGSRNVSAHRWAYELLVGPIPEGMVLDHRCRNRLCVNPAHLDPTTNRENVLRGVGHTAMNARKTHCKHGHEFTPENTYENKGMRYCRACNRINNRASRRRRRERALKEAS